MLGHFRHEVGHYYQWILVEQTGWIDECRELFGDERASYSEEIDRHYREGAPQGWQASYISEYATMHPWEDFAESFAHYLHIQDTLQTATSFSLGMTYDGGSFGEMIDRWLELTLGLNEVNRSMGRAPLYPFVIAPAVIRKLAFVDRVIRQQAGR